jgi:hypothetical protein
MIVETSGPLGAASVAFGQALADRPGDSDFFVDPTSGVAADLTSGQKARTQAVSFIRTMPALKRYRSLRGK